MIQERKVKKVGDNSMFLIIPMELRKHLNLEFGDTVFIEDTPGRITIWKKENEHTEPVRAI